MINRAFRTVAFLLCFTVSNAFIDSLFGGQSGGKNYPNVFCVVTHCASQSAACFANSDCSSNMKCMTSCGFTNHSCMYKCVNSYENQIFDNMMKCLVDDWKCLNLIPEDPSFRCSPPKQNIQNFDMAKLKGSWWLVRGLNRDFDCFDCQKSTFSPSAGSANYTVDENFDVQKVDGKIRHRVFHQQLQQQDVNNGGVLDYTNNLMGLTMYEKWQVLDFATSGNYMIVYYCGHLTDTWWYEGSFVYSRQPTLAPADMTAVANSLRNMGYDINKYCAPNTVNCQA